MNEIIDEKKIIYENPTFTKVNSVIKFILGLLIWFPFIFKYLMGILKNIEFISDMLQRKELIVIVDYKYAIYALIIFLSALIFKGKNKKAFIFLYILYILGFPFVVIFRILKILFKNILPISIRIWNIICEKLKNLKKLYIQLYILLLDILCFYIIKNFYSSWLIYVTMLLLFFLLTAQLYFLFSLTMDPLVMVNKFYLFIFNQALDYIKKTFFTKDGKNKDIVKEKDTLRTQIKMYGKIYNFLFNKVERSYNKQAILRSFIFLFFISLFFTIIVFSVEYYALIKINSNNFIIFGDNNFFSCLFYSISNLSTINSEIFSPQSNLAMLIIIIQAFIGIFIFYIFITSFTALSPEVFEESSKIKKKIFDKYDEIKDFLNSLSTKELNISLEDLVKEKRIDLKHDNIDK
jgi:hypothetical protein